MQLRLVAPFEGLPFIHGKFTYICQLKIEHWSNIRLKWSLQFHIVSSCWDAALNHTFRNDFIYVRLYWSNGAAFKASVPGKVALQVQVDLFRIQLSMLLFFAGIVDAAQAVTCLSGWLCYVSMQMSYKKNEDPFKRMNFLLLSLVKVS